MGLEPGELRRLTIPDNLIDEFYVENKLSMIIDGPDNQYTILQGEINPKKSALARYRAGKLTRLSSHQDLAGLKPKDTDQQVLCDALQDPDILCQVILGRAGTGKTTLAAAAAIDTYHDQGRRVLLTKPATYVGAAKAFGAVPGTVDEKYAPFLDSYKIVMSKVLGDHASDAIEQMLESGDLKFIPIEFARGCTYDDCTLIVDEAQNLTWHELSTIVSRVGENSKVILLGDLQQIDIRLPAHETGLWQLVHNKTFKQSKIACTVLLTHQYRSQITELITEVAAEIQGTDETDRPNYGRTR